ncbi:MAG: hypothetical protein QME81_12855 [bacterium]|nr:hypothetical protein [bacterium]
MIKGKIDKNGSPVLEVRIIGSRAETILRAILDTGFDGDVCLPATIAVSLGLELVRLIDSELADGKILENEPVFAGKMAWGEDIVDVDIVLTRSFDTLIGTNLLRGKDVRLDYSTGKLTIT